MGEILITRDACGVPGQVVPDVSEDCLQVGRHMKLVAPKQPDVTDALPPARDCWEDNPLQRPVREVPLVQVEVVVPVEPHPDLCRGHC